MSDYTHGNAYANDHDFDALSGYVTGTFTSEWRDIHGNLWRRTCTVINLGRSDAVPPANPHLAITDDGTDEDGNWRIGKMQPKTRELHARVRALLAEKPMTPREIAERLGVSFYRIQGFFVNQPMGFVVTERTRGGQVWGVK